MKNSCTKALGLCHFFVTLQQFFNWVYYGIISMVKRFVHFR